MTATEERDQLFAVARELHGALRDVLRGLTNTIYPIIGKLEARAQSLMVESADEKDNGVAVTPITLGKTEGPITLAPGKRACSMCGKPGHRKTTCPDAHKVRAADKAQKESKPSPPPKEPGKRYCSNCGFHGHRAKNCTKGKR